MTSFKELHANLESLRQNTARFWRVALHLHSIESHDWGDRPGCDQSLNDKALYEGDEGRRSFLRELKEHYDLVALTDHMKCSYACSLSSDSIVDSEFVVLPGMEINFQGEAALSTMQFHLLVILPEGSTVEDFAKFFANSGVSSTDSERHHDDIIKGKPLGEWVSLVRSNGGICIAAHVDNRRGVRTLFRQTGRNILDTYEMSSDDVGTNEKDISEELKNYLFAIDFDALEVAKPTDKSHYRWISRDAQRVINIPVVVGCDAHCIEELSNNDKTNWIKMTTPSCDDLREALKFADTRVRFKGELSSSPVPRLLGIELIGSNSSLFRNHTICFSENLNCIIGPRGSGKSTIVEVLRYVWGYNRTLGELDDETRRRIRGMQNKVLDGCTMRVMYSDIHDDIHVIESVYDPDEDYVSVVYTVDGENRHINNVDRSELFPLRLFGWSEIEALGRDKIRQRDLLDRLAPRIIKSIEERNKIREEMRKCRGTIEGFIRRLIEIYETKGSLIEQYKERKRQYDQINTEEMKSLFRELDMLVEKVKLYRALCREACEIYKIIRELSMPDINSDILGSFEFKDELEEWWSQEKTAIGHEDIWEIIKIDVHKIKRKILKYIAVINRRIKDMEKGKEETCAKIKSKIGEGVTEQNIAERRERAKGRLEEVEEIRKSYIECWKEFESALNICRDIARRMEGCKEEIHSIRESSMREMENMLNEFFGKSAIISLECKKGEDTREYEMGLERIAKTIKRTYIRDKIQERTARIISPIECSWKIIDFDEETEESINNIAESFGVDGDGARRMIEEMRPYVINEEADVYKLEEKGKRLMELLHIQEIDRDDMVNIKMGGRPVEELSPGQRSSAMLPLIALAEKDVPLVIDQPEDNLDNRMIGSVLVDILAKLKERRQIIVCTHNPNIVVLGDAEQVIVLEDKGADEAIVKRQGSIDKEDIVKDIIDIMEGGDEAFRNREKRYGLE